MTIQLFHTIQSKEITKSHLNRVEVWRNGAQTDLMSNKNWVETLPQAVLYNQGNWINLYTTIRVDEYRTG